MGSAHTRLRAESSVCSWTCDSSAHKHAVFGCPSACVRGRSHRRNGNVAFFGICDSGLFETACRGVNRQRDGRLVGVLWDLV
jgi:hypothetical protein